MLLILDISSSMLADDFPPNRLDAVKKTSSDFIESRKDDRIGILVFAGESFIQCPLTVDKKVLQSLIKEMNAGRVNTLITYNANPSYTLFNANEFNDALKKVDLKDSKLFKDCVRSSIMNITSWNTQSEYQQKKNQ